MNEMTGFTQGSVPVSSTKTPEPRPEQQLANGQSNSPSTPGTFTAFDWEEFETRYIQALEKADGEEQELLQEFDDLVKVRKERCPKGAVAAQCARLTPAPVLQQLGSIIECP